METLVYCPFCNTQSVPTIMRTKTVRNSSQRGGPVSHTEQEMVVIGDCQKCGKTKAEINKQFGL